MYLLSLLTNWLVALSKDTFISTLSSILYWVLYLHIVKVYVQSCERLSELTVSSTQTAQSFSGVGLSAVLSISQTADRTIDLSYCRQIQASNWRRTQPAEGWLVIQSLNVHSNLSKIILQSLLLWYCVHSLKISVTQTLSMCHSHISSFGLSPVMSTDLTALNSDSKHSCTSRYYPARLWGTGQGLLSVLLKWFNNQLLWKIWKH